MKGLFRLLSFVALVVAFVLVVVDGTIIISAKAWSFTSMGELLSRLASPGALERWQASVSRNLHPLLWSALNMLALRPPAAFVSAIAGVGFWQLGRKAAPDFDMTPRDRGA